MRRKERHEKLMEDVHEAVHNGYEEVEGSKINKIVIGFVGFCLLFLVLTLTIYNGGNDDILLGLIGSSKVDNNMAYAGNLTVEFDPNSYIKLVHHYMDNEGNEIKACLTGTKDGNYVEVTGIEFPHIFSQSYNHVESEICGPDTVISLHSHPNRRCLPSEQDVKSYEQLKKSNPDVLVAVMCESYRLYFYN